MFKTSAIHLWLHTVAVTAVLLFLVFSMSPAGSLPWQSPATTPTESPLNPTLELALGLVIGGGMACFLGFYLVLDFLQYLLVQAGKHAGQPANPGIFRWRLLLHSQVLALSIVATLLLLPFLLYLLRHLAASSSPDLTAAGQALPLRFAALRVLLVTLCPASLLVWLWHAPRLRAEWNAGYAR
jgi:hypothetical protein